MKKLFFILLVAVSSSMSIMSCTEESIEPTQTDPPTGTLPNPGKP